MNDRKMEIIQSLMEELQEMMEPGSEDFSERLGRPKPDVEISMSGEMPPDEDEDMPTKSPMGDDMSDEDSPDEMLKNRIMKMRHGA